MKIFLDELVSKHSQANFTCIWDYAMFEAEKAKRIVAYHLADVRLFLGRRDGYDPKEVYGEMYLGLDKPKVPIENLKAEMAEYIGTLLVDKIPEDCEYNPEMLTVEYEDGKYNRKTIEKKITHNALGLDYLYEWCPLTLWVKQTLSKRLLIVVEDWLVFDNDSREQVNLVLTDYATAIETATQYGHDRCVMILSYEVFQVVEGQVQLYDVDDIEHLYVEGTGWVPEWEPYAR